MPAIFFRAACTSTSRFVCFGPKWTFFKHAALKAAGAQQPPPPQAPAAAAIMSRRRPTGTNDGSGEQATTAQSPPAGPAGGDSHEPLPPGGAAKVKRLEAAIAMFFEDQELEVPDLDVALQAREAFANLSACRPHACSDVRHENSFALAGRPACLIASRPSRACVKLGLAWWVDRGLDCGVQRGSSPL